VKLAKLMLPLVLPVSLWTCDRATGVNPGADLTRTYLTDSPFPYWRVARVDLWVVNVSASLSADTGANAHFVTLASPNRRINVLALQNGGEVELGAVDLPKGALSAVRMVIDTDSSSITLRDGRVLTGTTSPGIQWQSYAGKPSLGALVFEPIAVPATGGRVLIDFDVGRTFTPQPYSTDSSFVFTPALTAIDPARAGAITGTVSTIGGPLANTSLDLYIGAPTGPSLAWTRVASTTTGTDGRFDFAGIPRSAYWTAMPEHANDTYIVNVAPQPKSGLHHAVVSNIGVAAGGETAVGTVLLGRLLDVDNVKAGSQSAIARLQDSVLAAITGLSQAMYAKLHAAQVADSSAIGVIPPSVRGKRYVLDAGSMQYVADASATVDTASVEFELYAVDRGGAVVVPPAPIGTFRLTAMDSGISFVGERPAGVSYSGTATFARVFLGWGSVQITSTLAGAPNALTGSSSSSYSGSGASSGLRLGSASTPDASFGSSSESGMAFDQSSQNATIGSDNIGWFSSSVIGFQLHTSINGEEVQTSDLGQPELDALAAASAAVSQVSHVVRQIIQIFLAT